MRRHSFPRKPLSYFTQTRPFRERLGESALLLLAGSTFTRSVLFELCKTFLLLLLAVTTVIVGLLLYEVSLQNNLGLATCLRVVPFVLPRALAYTISAAWLFAICAVYGSAAASNELLALQSSGISPFRLFLAPLAIAACLSLPTTWLMDIGDSRAKDGIEEVALQSATDIAYRSLRSTKSCRGKNAAIAVRDVKGTQLIQPVVFCDFPGEEGPLVGTAERAELDYDAEKREMRVVLVNGSITRNDDTTLRFPQTFVIRTRLGNIGPKLIGHNATLWELPGAIADQQQLVLDLKEQLKRSTSNREAASDDDQKLHSQLARAQFRLFRLKTYPHRRLSQGLCCLSFTIFGWPLAVLLRFKDTVTTFFLAFLPVVLFFYPCEMFFAKNEGLPPYSLWSCHVVLILAGLYLFRKL
jgi:lipopolysaccharide export system permease protein